MLADRFPYCLWAVAFLLSGSTHATTSTPNGWKFTLENAGGHSVSDSASPGSQPLYFTYEPVELVLKYEITSRPDLSVRPERVGPDVVDILRRVEVRIEPVAGDGEVEVRRLSSAGFRWISLLHDGSYQNLPLEDLESDDTTLAVGDTVLFRFALEDLSPGDWRVAVVLPSHSEWKTAERQSVVVDVRTGNETEELQKYYLRQRRLIEPWPEYRKLTLQLIELEPRDWTLWRDLGARAITHGDSGEALHLLERARAVLEAEIQRGAFVPEVQVRGLETLLEFRDFRSVYERERLRSKREVGLRLRPIEGGFEWRWFDVQTGLSMNRFDVSDPSPDLEELESAMAEIGEDRIPLSKARRNQMGKNELRRITIRPQDR